MSDEQKTAVTEYRPSGAGKLSHVDPQELLDRIASGQYIPDIAKEIGVSKQAVSYRFRKLHPEAYQQAREIGCEIRLQDAAQRIEAAAAAVDLARARETFRASAWFAEREFPARWGAKQQVDMRVEHVDLGDRLRRAQARTIEGSATVVSTQPDAEMQRSIPGNRDNSSHS